MRRWLLPLALLAALIFGERLFLGTDVAKMEPVELVWVTASGDGIAVQTDTGSSGRGESITGAVEDMKQTAAGEIFLETAEYVLLSGVKEETLPELMAHFRPSCRILFARGQAKPEDAAAFLRTHRKDVTLLDWKTGEKEPPILKAEEGRMYLAE